MFSNSRLAAGVLALSSLIGFSSASPLALERRQEECISYGGGSPVVVYISTNVITYPVLINTYIENNTIININGGVTININNAPTQLSTTVTATATVTSYSTVTATATVTPVVPETFVIVVNAAAAKNKRQENIVAGSEYLTFNGNNAAVTSDRSQAAQFSSSNNQLISGGFYVGVSNASLATGYAAFELFSSPPDISTTWSVVIGGSVSFSNSAFTFAGGFAAFCLADDGSLEIEATAAPPFTCIAVVLSAQAVDAASSTSSTMSSTTTPASSMTSAPTTTTTPTSTPTSSSSTFDPSGALDSEPTPTAKARSIAMHKKSMNGEVRRGGLFKSPMKA